MTALQPTIDNAAAANVSADRAQTKPAPQAAPAVSAKTVSAKTWLAVFGATLGAFMAVLNIQIVNASLATYRARSAPASTTAAGSPPPT